LVGRQEGHPACKKMGDAGGGHCLVRMEWRPSGWSVCLPLLIFPCTIKSRSSLLAPAHPGGPGKRAIKCLWCGCICLSGSYILCVVHSELVFDIIGTDSVVWQNWSCPCLVSHICWSAQGCSRISGMLNAGVVLCLCWFTGKWPLFFVASVCLSVCLCRVFLSRLWSDFDQTRTYAMCLGLVVSHRI